MEPYHSQGKPRVSSFPKIMGILNVTPDSFSDGGKYLDPHAALDHALEMEEVGADILDIGAASSRPGSHFISAIEEIQRIKPVLSQLAGKIKIPLSIDTHRLAVLEMAVDYGISILNDISALGDLEGGREDVAEKKVEMIKAYDLKVILMHMQSSPRNMQDDPQYVSVVEDVISFLKKRAHFAIARGISRENIWLDPGFGFGKNFEHNHELFWHLEKLLELKYPVVVGISRKKYVKSLFGEDLEKVEMGSALLGVISCIKGAQILRVHDVKRIKKIMGVIL